MKLYNYLRARILTTLSLLAMLGGLGLGSLHAQWTLYVNELPNQTPPADTLFVTSALNDWLPADPAYQLTRFHDGSWSITIDSLPENWEFKFTRGSWKRVEGDLLGNALPNHVWDVKKNPGDTLQIKILSWEDMVPLPVLGSLRVVVEHIPENTPPASPIFIVGNFNSWHPGDPRYQLTPIGDSLYEAHIPVFHDTLAYKFTRGNWETIEAQKNGRARTNRTYLWQSAASAEVRVQITAWEDLSGNAMNPLTFIWWLSAILGIFLVLVILTVRKNTFQANYYLSAFIMALAIALTTRAALYDREVFQTLPKLLLIPDLIYFLYAPLFWLYIRTLMRSEGDTTAIRKNGLHFVPFFLHLFSYFSLFLMDQETFISGVVDLSFRPTFWGAGALALVYNTLYWIFIFRYLKGFVPKYEAQDPSQTPFLRTIMYLQGLCLLIGWATVLTGGMDWILDQDLTYITDRSTDVMWICLSLTVFFLGYYAFAHPEMFQFSPIDPQPVETSVVELEPPKSIRKDDFEEKWKEKVTQYMETEKAYLRPKITLSEVAEAIGTNTHELSRTINEGFEMNFNEFINNYRVKEFQNRLANNEHASHTLLALALEVGFNSKTAFNRAFKKITGQTPREYVKNLSANQDELTY
ncbi:MAG: helix-turn-helix domain-containing protein [Bacteroidota bacterium]